MRLAAEIPQCSFHDLRGGSKKTVVDLVDISTNGFSIKTFKPLPADSHGVAEGHQAGCEISSRLPPAVRAKAIAARIN